MYSIIPMATAPLHNPCHLIDAITPPFQIVSMSGPLTTNALPPLVLQARRIPLLTSVQALAGSFLTKELSSSDTPHLL